MAVTTSIQSPRILFAQFGRGTPFIHARLIGVSSDVDLPQSERRIVVSVRAATKPAISRPAKSLVLNRSILHKPTPVTKLAKGKRKLFR